VRYNGWHIAPACLQADIAYWPFAERFQLLLSHFFGLDMRELGPPQIGQWIDVMQQRLLCQIAAANPDLFLQAVEEHKTIDFFDYATYNACDLHPHLSVARWWMICTTLWSFNNYTVSVFCKCYLRMILVLVDRDRIEWSIIELWLFIEWWESV